MKGTVLVAKSFVVDLPKFIEVGFDDDLENVARWARRIAPMSESLNQ